MRNHLAAQNERIQQMGEDLHLWVPAQGGVPPVDPVEEAETIYADTEYDNASMDGRQSETENGGARQVRVRQVHVEGESEAIVRARQLDAQIQREMNGGMEIDDPQPSHELGMVEALIQQLERNPRRLTWREVAPAFRRGALGPVPPVRFGRSLGGVQSGSVSPTPTQPAMSEEALTRLRPTEMGLGGVQYSWRKTYGPRTIGQYVPNLYGEDVTEIIMHLPNDQGVIVEYRDSDNEPERLRQGPWAEDPAPSWNHATWHSTSLAMSVDSDEWMLGENPILIAVPFLIHLITAGASADIPIEETRKGHWIAEMDGSPAARYAWPLVEYWYQQTKYWRKIALMYPWYIVFGQDEGILVNSWVYAKLGQEDAYTWMSPRGESWIGGYKNPNAMDVIWTIPDQPRPLTPTSYSGDWEREDEMYN